MGSNMFKHLMQSALQIVYPNQCSMCATLVDDQFALCAECWSQVEFIGSNACKFCGTPMIGATTDHGAICDSCMTTPRPWSSGVAAIKYSDLGRKLVLALKHGDRTDLSGTAAVWMSRQIDPWRIENPVLVPVPLNRYRLLKRKYNQSALLAADIGANLEIDVSIDALRRPIATPSLDGKSAQERFAILEQAIEPNDNANINGRLVILIDDVMTSGATLSACTAACYKAGAKDVKIAVLARVAKDA